MNKPGKMFGEVLNHLFRKPATENYPAEPAVMPENFRGKIRFIAERCVGCKLCMKDCPAEAITIKKVGDKQFEATFHLDRCMFCAQCVQSCNKDALESTLEFELAALNRDDLEIRFKPSSKKNDEQSDKTTTPATGSDS